MSETGDGTADTSAADGDSSMSETTPSAVHFTTDPTDENDVFDQHM